MITQSLVVSPTDGEVYDFGPLHIVARITGEQSGGSFELYDLSMGPGAVDYHVHNKMDETLCVVEGEVEFVVSGESFVRAAGSVAFVPRGLHHGFTNHGPAQTRVLILFTPSGMQDEYFSELVRVFKNPTPDPIEIERLQVKYDQELVPAP
jgi:quercetin dioxygenase-like cupin family protein